MDKKREALLNQLKPAVREAYLKWGLINETDSREFHSDWSNATRGESPAEARERSKILAKLEG